MSDDLEVEADFIELIACEAVSSGHCVITRDGHPMFVGSLADLPKVEQYDRIFVAPQDILVIREFIKKFAARAGS